MIIFDFLDQIMNTKLIFKGMVFYYETCSDLLLEKFIVITITLYISLKGLVMKDFSIFFFLGQFFLYPIGILKCNNLDG